MITGAQPTVCHLLVWLRPHLFGTSRHDCVVPSGQQHVTPAKSRTAQNNRGGPHGQPLLLRLRFLAAFPVLTVDCDEPYRLRNAKTHMFLWIWHITREGLLWVEPRLYQLMPIETTLILAYSDAFKTYSLIALLARLLVLAQPGLGTKRLRRLRACGNQG